MFIKYSKTKLKNGFEIYHIPVSKGSGVIKAVSRTCWSI